MGTVEEKEKERGNLDSDIIALFESMNNEEAAVLDETRESNPESVVGDELEEAAFLLEYELVEAPANNKVENETNKEEDEDDTRSTNARLVSRIRHEGNLSTTSCCGVHSERVLAVLGGDGLFKVWRIRIRLADSIDLSRTLNACGTAVGITIAILNEGRLAGNSARSVAAGDLLGVEDARGKIVPVVSAETDRGVGGPAGRRGDTAEVEVHHVAVEALEDVVGAGGSVVVERRKVVFVRLLLLVVRKSHLTLVGAV